MNVYIDFYYNRSKIFLDPINDSNCWYYHMSQLFAFLSYLFASFILGVGSFGSLMNQNNQFFFIIWLSVKIYINRVIKSSSHQVIKSSSHQVIKSSSHQVIKSSSHQVNESSSSSHQVIKSSSSGTLFNKNWI